MFGYHPFYNLNLHTGPVFGFLVNEKIEFEVEGTSIHSNINKAANKEISFGWQFGASLEIKRLSFVLRYEVEVYESVDDIIIPNSGVILKPGIRNSLWQFTVGYKLFSMAAE